MHADKLDDDADEQSFIELIIASERVHKMIENIRKGKNNAVLELRAAVEQSPAYAEEARRAGIVKTLTKVLASSGDEEVLDAAACIITACCGHMACGGKIRSFDYDGVHVDIKEGALGDGLGAKVWSVAHVLAREIVRHPELVKGKRVLEIGAGCGLNGIVAAKIGASEVVLTDVEGPVLKNLAQCANMNVAKEWCGQAALPNEKELFEDAEEVEDFNLNELMGDAGEDPTISTHPWDAGTMRVRLLDWAESMKHLDSSSGRGDKTSSQGEDYNHHDAELPPQVPLDCTFEVILGNEVMYEPLHAKLVAAVIAHKLAPGGACVLCCAVRDLETFAVFKSQCKLRGLRYRECHFEPTVDDGHCGILSARSDYEGGFLLMAVDHEEAVCNHWYREW